MSPHERDLRAALHAGDDDAGFSDADAARLVAASRDAVRQRRVRLAGAVGAVVLVGGLGTAVGFGLSGSNGSGTSGTADSAAGGVAPDHGGQRGVSSAGSSGRVSGPESSGILAGPATPAPAPSSATDGGASCPATFPRLMTPGGGGTGQFGASGKLFANPVVRVLACGYSSISYNSDPAYASTFVTGSQATELVDSLESAPLTPREQACPMLRPAEEQEVAFYGITSSGSVLPPVTAVTNVPACQVVVTNGTAIRHDWTLPKDLAAGPLSAIVTGARTAPAEPSKVGTPAH